MSSTRLSCGASARALMACSMTLALAALGAPAAAQLVTVGRVQYQQRPVLPLDCAKGGEWLGPYDLEKVMNPGLAGRNPTVSDRNWAEITHAILLPPPSDALSMPSSRVLLIARRFDLGTQANPGGDIPQEVFIWDRGAPAALTTMVVDPSVDDGSAELFCAGHTLTAGGNVLFVGGTDEVNQMTFFGSFWGHDKTFLFLNRQQPSWVYESFAEPPAVPPVPPMQRARWYPTAIRLADASILVAGHGFNPIAVPDTAQTRERCDVDDVNGTVTWRSYANGPLLNNLVGSGCNILSLVDLQIYPRMHQLVSGEVFATLAQSEVLTLEACPNTANPDRWTKITSAIKPAPDANTVHYIDLTPETGPVETIYSLGGVVDGTHTLATNRVVRMDVNLAAPGSSAWTNAGVPQLNAGRIYLHTVILLDGSMATFGGVTEDPDSLVDTYFKHPELYRPPGVFAAPDTAWSYLNPQADERTYHMVSLLLPSGEVFTAGGQGTSVFAASLQPDPPWYTVEIYRPFYMCNPARPAIVSAPASLAFGARGAEVAVRLHSASSAGETRVALIGPESVTHAMDSGQVYIRLKFAPFTPNPDPTQPTTIHFDAPPNGNVAPPGWYLLTVVNAEGLPSEAQWVRVGVP